MGADFIEPDLVSHQGRRAGRPARERDRRDHRRRRPARVRRPRRTTKTVDGVSVTGWFTEDFTLAELKTLRAKERLPAVRQENTLYDGLFQVPTFDEVLDAADQPVSGAAAAPSGCTRRPSTPRYFRSVGPAAGGAAGPRAAPRRPEHAAPRRSFVQSFELTNLRRAAGRLGLRTPRSSSPRPAGRRTTSAPATRARTPYLTTRRAGDAAPTADRRQSARTRTR